MKRRSTASSIGLIYTIACVLSTWSFVVPLITIMPTSILLESIFESILGNEDYSMKGRGVLITLLVTFILVTFFFFRSFFKKLQKAQEINVLQFHLLLIIQLFVVHPLVFYLQTSQDWNRASDGQFIFGILDSYPLSSVVFVLFGVALDLMRNSFGKRKTISPSDEAM